MNVEIKLRDYKKELENQQLSDNTIKTYLREASDLENFLKDTKRDKADMIEYIDYLKALTVKDKKAGARPKYKLVTINNKIVQINKYLKFIGEEDKTLKEFKIQTTDAVESMTNNDFKRMYKQAQEKGTDRDQLMLQVLYRTGLRVSEISYFTVEAVKAGYMQVYNKGKYRIVGIPKTLAKQAKEYITKHNIKSGSIILNRNGQPLGRNYVFKRIKYLGGQARIKLDKVYPHSIRHLFAKNMARDKNINPLQLADILGHSSISTTRGYTALSIDEVKKIMDN